jgi:hypothetical protein
MTTRVFSSRALLGVGVITAALGLSLAMPAGATVARSLALPTLRPGSSGASVSALQHTLAIRRSGVYDAATVAAVKRVQKWKKISPANGVVAVGTWPAMADPTMSARMATSSVARKTLTLAAFQASVHGFGVTYRESKRICTAVSGSGLYRGKWQMSSALWRSFGGLSFAKTADRASCAQQDSVALRVWRSSWWKPWGG